jgi:hypothetical protein
MYNINKQYLLIASINGKQIYKRVFKGYLSNGGLELSINDSIKHDFKNYECKVIEF